jgi:outer membrane lipoprotein carrier protein
MTRFKSLAALTAGLLLAARPASALEQFKSFVSTTKAAKGEFSQRQVKNSAGEKAKVSSPASGTFVFARPGKFIWTYTKPYEQVLQADGDKLYIYDKDLNQVTVKKLGDALGSSPAAILFGSNDLEKNFTLSEAAPRMARNAARGAEEQGHLVRGNHHRPERRHAGAMELKDSFGQSSVLTFKGIEKSGAECDEF